MSALYNVALVGIPHQTPAKILWYEDREDLLNDAIDDAINTGKEEPETFDEAVSFLADDWHSYLLVECAEDIHIVRNYKGHQAARVQSFVDDLEAELGPEFVDETD